MVVNKVDLVGDGELAEVVAFTARVVAGRLGQPVPVFPLSALAARRRSDGFDTFAAWLAAKLESRLGPRAGLYRPRAAPRGHRVARLRPGGVPAPPAAHGAVDCWPVVMGGIDPRRR